MNEESRKRVELVQRVIRESLTKSFLGKPLVRGDVQEVVVEQAKKFFKDRKVEVVRVERYPKYENKFVIHAEIK